MSFTTELEKIYRKVRRVRNGTCDKFDRCEDCQCQNQYLDEKCDFEDIMKDIKDLINVVDSLGIYRNKEEEDD